MRFLSFSIRFVRSNCKLPLLVKSTEFSFQSSPWTCHTGCPMNICYISDFMHSLQHFWTFCRNVGTPSRQILTLFFFSKKNKMPIDQLRRKHIEIVMESHNIVLKKFVLNCHWFLWNSIWNVRNRINDRYHIHFSYYLWFKKNNKEIASFHWFSVTFFFIISHLLNITPWQSLSI